MEKKIRKCLSARDFLVLAFIIMEYFISFLCFSRRKSRRSLALVIKLAVEISKYSFCIRSLKSNSSVYGYSFLISTFSIRLSLIEEYMGQLIKKWVSSSICVKQNGHFRLCTVRLLCLPFSIISWWLDNLNFYLVRWLSIPIVVYIFANVRSLEEFCWILKKASW